jgi:hypothetical protein
VCRRCTRHPTAQLSVPSPWRGGECHPHRGTGPPPRPLPTTPTVCLIGVSKSNSRFPK